MSTRRKLAIGIAVIGGWLLFSIANMVWNPHTSSSGPAGRHSRSPKLSLLAAHRADAATVQLGPGRDSAAFTIRRPQGEIVLYRIRAPRGARVRATTQIPGLTTRLAITTGRPSAVGSCRTTRSLVTCTTGEEGCPMPAATWHVRVWKLAGPAGNVTIWFRVGKPPSSEGA
jgi:hypothetical protein